MVEGFDEIWRSLKVKSNENKIEKVYFKKFVSHCVMRLNEEELENLDEFRFLLVKISSDRSEKAEAE